MTGRAIVVGLLLVLAGGAGAMAAPAAATSAEDRPTARQAVRQFCDLHNIVVEGLERVGEEGVSVPAGRLSGLTLLRGLLQQYSYMAFWSERAGPAGERLPTRLVIIGPAGSPGTSTATVAPPPSGAPPADAPPEVAAAVADGSLPAMRGAGRAARSQLSRTMTNLALQAVTDTSIPALGGTTPVGPAPRSGVAANAAMAAVQMASLTQVAAQQLQNLVSALRASAPVTH